MEEIFNQYYEKIYYWSINKTNSKEDAKDLTNDIFLAIFQYINKNVEIKKLDNLIWKIAHNIWNKQALNYIKEKNNIALEEYHTTYEINSIDKIIYKEIINDLEKFKLTDKERLCFKYYYFDDLSIKEISDIIKSAESNIKYYLYSARNKIKEEYYD